MKNISKESLSVLESYCDQATEYLQDMYKPLRSNILDEFKKRLRFKRNYKVEKNFGYIYYEVSNFDKILNGNVKVLKESVEIYKKLPITLLYIKRYKLLLNNEEVVNLEITQELTQISLCQEETETKNGFIIPVFICSKIVISLNQNGFTVQLNTKYYDIEKLGYLNSIILKNIFKLIKVKITNQDDNQYYNVEIYYDEKLVLNEKDSIRERISEFLAEQLALGNITDKDLIFTKKTTEEKEKITKKYWVCLEFTKKGLLKDRRYNLNFDARKLRCELTNDSKVKIVVTKTENCLDGKVVTLDYFVKKVLQPSIDNLCVKSGWGTYPLDVCDCDLKTKDGKSIPLYNAAMCYLSKQCDLMFGIKKEKSIFLPTVPIFKNQYFTDKPLITKAILFEFVKRENDKVYLIQYSYVKRSKNEKYILRLVYQMKQASFTFGLTKLENIVLPVILQKKCCLIKLDGDEILNFKKIDKNSFYEVSCPSIRTYKSEIINCIFEESFNKKKYKINLFAGECDFFKDGSELDFSKTKQVLFNAYKVKEQYDEHLNEEQINMLEQYYNTNL